MSASTASSCSRENTRSTSACRVSCTGISVVAYPAAAAWRAISSIVRTSPIVESVRESTPIVRKDPSFSARAALFGRYPRSDIDASTRCLVSSTTVPVPFATRETVCAETPACAATSAIDTRARRGGVGVAVMGAPELSLVMGSIFVVL